MVAKLIKPASLMLSLAMFAMPLQAYASCANFLDDVGSTSLGVSYKKDPETGKIVALMMMGEASFLAPKSSLVRKAKKKALMNAKAEFVRFMKEDFVAADLVSDLTAEAKTTDSNGNTTGQVEEISAMAETMASSSQAVISGIVVLGECVDTEEKVAMVFAGWKPELSAAGAEARKAMKAEAGSSAAGTQTAANSGAATTSNSGSSSSTASSSQSTDRSTTKVGITVITVEAEGEGANLKQATNEAIRSAIAQVLGEKFASSQLSTDFTASVEVTGANGDTVGAALETSTQLDVTASEVSGIVSGYSYLSKEEISTGIKVVLNVEIPKYELSLDKNKNTLIVFRPEIKKADGITASEMDQIADAIRNDLENILNESGKLEVLDRSYLQQRNIELGTVAVGNNSMTELARVGNLAGADFMLVMEFEKLSSKVEEKTVGENVIVRQVFDGSANFKVIEVATSNIVSSGKVPVQRLKFRKDNGVSQFSVKVSDLVSRRIVRKLGGNVSNASLGGGDDSQNVKKAAERAEARLKKLEEEVKNDW